MNLFILLSILNRLDVSLSSAYITKTEYITENVLATQYALHNNSTNDISADSNWWGTVTTAKIDSLIYDIKDDWNLGTVDYTPFLTSRSTPPFLDSIRVNSNLVGIETLKVYFTFSKSMDTTVAPKVLFAIDDTCIDTVNALQTSGVWADSMHWNGWRIIDEMVLDTIYRIRVSDARDNSFPFPIPTDTRGTFRVYTVRSTSRELIAESGTDKITLYWHHSSVSNLLGYNIYRGTTSGGPYELLNSKVITDTTYTDTTMPHGKTSYYIYTILDNNFHANSYSSEVSGYIGVEEIPIPTVFAPLSPNPRLDVGLSSAYITKIEYITDLPVSAFFLKPVVEYGSNWGGLMEDFYVSVDCNDSVQKIFIELGGNCLRLGPFYRQKIKWVELTGSAGLLRIDIAGLASGKRMGFNVNSQIDEERNGGFVGLKLRYAPFDMLRLTPFLCYGMVKEGKFLEYGIELSFSPFINSEASDLLKKLGFSAGISGAQLGAELENESFSLIFGYYLIGLTYQMEIPTQEHKPSSKTKKAKEP